MRCEAVRRAVRGLAAPDAVPALYRGLPASTRGPAAATANGSGLNPSPSNALDENVPGFCDFLDAGGNWVGTGTTPPATAVYVRRWAIVPLPTNPNNTIILQVLVFPASRNRGAADLGRGRRLPEEARLITVKTRKAQ